MPRQKSVKVPDAVGAFDLGAFGPKGFFAAPRQIPQAFHFPPHQISLLPEQIKMLFYNPALAPEVQMWVKTNGQAFAIGNLAKVRFHAQLGLRSLKTDSAIAKVLVAAWLLHQRLALPNRFSLSFSVLLPPGEYSDRVRFKRELVEALREFESPSGILRVTVLNLLCFPEGGGIAMHRQVTDDAFNRKTVSCSTIGFRDTNILNFDRGVEANSHTGKLGFIQLVQKVQQRTSGLDMESLVPAIAQAGAKPFPFHFAKLARRTRESDRQQELVEIVQAVRESRAEYLQELFAWYSEVMPSVWDELILCGGTAEHLSDELLSHFRKPNQTVWFHGGIKLPEGLDDLGLGVRLCDAYASFIQLHAMVVPQQLEVTYD